MFRFNRPVLESVPVVMAVHFCRDDGDSVSDWGAG